MHSFLSLNAFDTRLVIIIFTSSGKISNYFQNGIMQLDVRWPPVSLSIEPQEIETYSDQEVTASVIFPKSYCDPSMGSLVPETWISLIYCGHSPIECKLDNISHMSQVIFLIT